MSAQDARGPEDEDYERAWRPAVRQDVLPTPASPATVPSIQSV
jgi:hypothetical protein